MYVNCVTTFGAQLSLDVSWAYRNSLAPICHLRCGKIDGTRSNIPALRVRMLRFRGLSREHTALRKQIRHTMARKMAPVTGEISRVTLGFPFRVSYLLEFLA
jgi:hypothetical protein